MLVLILHTAKLLFPCSSARSTLFPLGLGDVGRDPVRDHNDQQLAYAYYEDEPGRLSAAKLLTKDEARRIFRCPHCSHELRLTAWRRDPPCSIFAE